MYALNLNETERDASAWDYRFLGINHRKYIDAAGIIRLCAMIFNEFSMNRIQRIPDQSN